MSQMLKCPNPSCPYVFDPSLVPAGVVLSCPRCGMQFTLGPPAAAPAPPPEASATPAAPPAPSPDTSPRNEPKRESRERERNRDREPVEPTSEKSRLPMYLFAGCVVAFMSCTFLVGIVVVFSLAFKRNGGPGDGVTKMPDYNIAIDSVPSSWTRDENTQSKLGAPFVLAYRNEKTEAYVAFGAREPEKGRPPRSTEMRRTLTAALAKCFVQSSMQAEQPPATEWLTRPIGQSDPYPDGFKFQAESADGLKWTGEAYVVSHKGIAYYWVCWCGESDYDQLKNEFANFREKFKLLDPNRPDWKEQKYHTTNFKGNAVSYTITDPEGLWKEIDAKEFESQKVAEPDLDKRLRVAFTPYNDKKAIPDQAELSTYILPAGADPTLAARRYVEEIETKRIQEAGAEYKVTFTELTDPPHGDPSPVPDDLHQSTPVVRLLMKVQGATNNNRLIVVSGVAVGERTVVAMCWTEATKRDVFEAKLVQIASSLR